MGRGAGGGQQDLGDWGLLRLLADPPHLVFSRTSFGLHHLVPGSSGGTSVLESPEVHLCWKGPLKSEPPGRRFR